MSAGDSSSWLPAGWTAELKLVYGRQVECYCNPETGQTFYTQNDVMRYVNARNAKSCPSETPKEMIDEKSPMQTDDVPKSSTQLTNKRKKMLAKKSPMRHAVETDEVPEYEPDEVPKCAPDEVPKCAPDEVLKCAPDEVPKCEPNEVPKCAPDEVPKCAPDEVPKCAPDEVPKCAPDEVPKSSPPSTNRRKKMLAKKSPMPHVVQIDEAPEWLPEGWTEVMKTRNTGVKYKCYIEPVSGSKFYSKPAVSRYLQALKGKTPKSTEKKRSMDSNSNDCVDKTVDCESSTVSKVASQDIETSNGKLGTSQDFETPKGRQSTPRKKNLTAVVMYSPITVETLRVESPADLPEGWIKELKIQMKGDKVIRKDPFFTDPVSGYIFRSKPDALRFLKSGDILSCAIKPKRKDVDNLEATNNDIHSQPSDDKPKLADNTPNKPLFTDKEKRAESFENSHLSTPEAEKMENKTPKTESRKRKEIAKAVTLPTRSSKRLLGVKAELDGELDERSLVAAARKLEARKPLKPAADLETETENNGSKITTETPPPAADLEHSNQTLEKPAEEKDDQTGTMELPEKEPKEDENGESSFYFEAGNLFFDPCIEFAVNTLKGKIPIDDNLSVQDYLQIDEDPQQKYGGDSEPSFSNFPSQFDSPLEPEPEPKPNHTQPLQVLPPFVSPGNDNRAIPRSDGFKG